jgi:hypothetical protein
MLYKEKNDDAYTPVPLSNVAAGGNLYRLSFGTSAGRAVADGTGMIIDTDTPGEITLSALNSGASQGKIAGSEDGITFYFKEVAADKNFRLSADVTVHNFGFAEKAAAPKTDLNGQEGFGIMARDYVPQYPGYDYSAGDLDDKTAQDNYYAGSTGGMGNMIMVGGVKRGVRAYWRTGVLPSPDDAIHTNAIADSANSIALWQPREMPDYSEYDVAASGTYETVSQRYNARPDFPNKGTKYTLYLEKTNNGFTVRITPPADKSVGWSSDEAGIATPNTKGKTWEYAVTGQEAQDLLFSVNKEHYYVGFFACRDAKATFTNIQYSEADAADCAPRVELLPEYMAPTFAITSPMTASSREYTLHARANVEGVMSVSLNGKALPSRAGTWTVETTNSSADPFADFAVPVDNLVQGDNVFTVQFTPNKSQPKLKYLLSNTDTIKTVWTVNGKLYGYVDEAGVNWIVASPAGKYTNSGTYDSPVDVDTAIAYVNSGGTVLLKDGVYQILSLIIPRYNDGTILTDTNGISTVTAPKTLQAEHRDKVIFDFAKDKNAKGFQLNGDGWVVDGIHVRNTPNKVKGFTVGGSYNTVKWVKTYNNGDTGLQVSGNSKEPKALWPKYNLIQNCESFSNMDDAREDADGFASKLTSGEGNVFERCVAHHNVDDGWDLFSKSETGKIGAVLLDRCIAYSNGKYLADDTTTNSGGNGFKMGGEGLSVPHRAVDCISFNNDSDGFTSNSDPSIILEYCTSFNNARNFNVYASSSSVTVDAEILQLLSLFSEGTHAKDGVALVYPSHGYAWDGTASKNSAGRAISTAQVMDFAPPYVTQAPFDTSIHGNFLRRNPTTGAFVLNDFLQPNNDTLVGDIPGARGLW